MKREYPILEFDSSRIAVLNPENVINQIPDIPEHAVMCFFQDVIDHFNKQGLLHEIASLKSEMGLHPIYLTKYTGSSIVLFHPGIGSPLAAGILEEVIALGCKKFIVCGGAGVLDKEIVSGHFIIPKSAIRDEGTSYHYIQPSREIKPSPEAVTAIETVLKGRNIEYIKGKTWTTDAIYRETERIISNRKSEGCLTVEMEASALFAVSQFRNVKLGQILYAGDNLDTEIWDSRDWQENWNIREKLVAIALEASLLIK